MGKTFLNDNNWGGRRKIKKKLEAYVRIEMDKDDPHLIVVSERDRNIFLYKNDLNLAQYRYEIKLFT